MFMNLDLPKFPIAFFCPNFSKLSEYIIIITNKIGNEHAKNSEEVTIEANLTIDRVVPLPEALVKLSSPSSLEIVATDISRDENEGAWNQVGVAGDAIKNAS